jgi:hypothetical protein
LRVTKLLSTWNYMSDRLSTYQWTLSAALFLLTAQVMVAFVGRAVAQAVSRRLPAPAARVRSQVRSCGICGGQLTLGQVFSEFSPSTIPNSLSSTIRGWYNRQNSDRLTKWIQSRLTPKKKKNYGGFFDITAATMKTAVFWIVTPCTSKTASVYCLFLLILA